MIDDILNKIYTSDLLTSEELHELTEWICNKTEKLEKENEILKHRLNDIIFDDANDDVELGARYLRNIGYIGFDEERKIYLNKHNKEPFWQNDEREKNYYIKDEELNEYTEQLEYKLQQKENKIKQVREYVDKWENIARYKLLEMLDEEDCRIG